MTTTAHEDQFTAAPEPVRQPYDTVAILRRNIADMEVAMRTQTERAEASEAELAKLAQQKPVAWRPVVGFDGLYEVSSEGDIRNAQTGNIAAKHLMGDGYVKADLWKRGKRKQTSAHRVVAEAFIGPIDGLEINHRNGVKTDNRVANLEITTRSENVNHSYYELGNIIKPIVATNTTSGQSTEYRSIEEAVREGGFRSSSIYDCLNGKVKTHSGHSFSRPAAPVPAPHKGATHCDDCGLTWLDDGLNPLRCPYCKDAIPAPAVPAAWREVMAELAADLQSACDAEHPHRDQYPSVMRKYNNDMEIVEKARALLQSAEVRHD